MAHVLPLEVTLSLSELHVLILNIYIVEVATLLSIGMISLVCRLIELSVW